jgi:hypothetical protein
MITGARKQGLHLVLIWFGSWKNGTSTYVPGWVKKNPQQYLYDKDATGKTLETLSTFGEATMQADANAFKHLMAHVKAVDEKNQTVIMVQVENEVGVLRSNRDYTAEANKAFDGDIPDDLSKYLSANKNNLAPELYQVWKANGFKITVAGKVFLGKAPLIKKIGNIYPIILKNFLWLIIMPNI